MKLGLTLKSLMVGCAVIMAADAGHAAYIDMGNGMIYDDRRSLLWQKSDDGVRRSFSDAVTYCNELRLGDMGNWRLPSIEILSTLVDDNYTPTINLLFFSRAAMYYSSSTVVKIQTDYTGVGMGVTFVKMIDFSNGTASEAPIYEVDGMIADAYTRCVITGYVPPPESLNSIMFLLLEPAAP